MYIYVCVCACVFPDYTGNIQRLLLNPQTSVRLCKEHWLCSLWSRNWFVVHNLEFRFQALLPTYSRARKYTIVYREAREISSGNEWQSIRIRFTARVSQLASLVLREHRDRCNVLSAVTEYLPDRLGSTGTKQFSLFHSSWTDSGSSE